MASETPHEADPANPAYCVSSCVRCADEVRAVEDDLEEHPARGTLGSEAASQLIEIRHEIDMLRDDVASLMALVASSVHALTAKIDVPG